MINSLLLLLDIDGTLCPIGPGPDVAMHHLSIGSGSVSFRADLPEVLAELAARYELAWATAWQDNANLLLSRSRAVHAATGRGRAEGQTKPCDSQRGSC